MRFLTIFLVFASLSAEKEYPLDFFSDWKATITFPSNFVVTSDNDRVKYLSHPHYLHSNSDIRLFRTELVGRDGESIFVFFDPKKDDEYIFILHINPQDSDKYDFLMTKNKDKGVWEKTSEEIFPKGSLDGLLAYLYEKTDLFIAFDQFELQ